MTPQLRYAVEPVTRVVRGKVYTRYRWVQYRPTVNFDGQVVYLRKSRQKRTELTVHSAAYEGELAIYREMGVPPPWFLKEDWVYRLDDARDGEPVTERDALKFLSEMTHGMAALDKLRDLLTGNV